MDTNKKKKKWPAVLLALLLLMGVSAGGVFGVVNHYLNKINDADTSQQEIVPPEQETFGDGSEEGAGEPVEDPDSVVWDGVQPIDCKGLINVMLVGQDRREGQGRQRSDAMILCSINPNTKQVSLISFLRDLYVTIPGKYSDNRLNATYVFGGFPLLDDTLMENFGIPVDYNIEVDFDGFEAIVNSVGGVDIELTAAEARHLGMKTGVNHMNGQQALTYARIRKIDSDFNRTQRQRTVLMAVFQKLRGQSLGQLLKTMETILPYVTTDMSNGEMIQLATRLFPVLSGANIQSYHIPAKGTYRSASIRGMSVLVPDLKQNHQLLVDQYLPLG